MVGQGMKIFISIMFLILSYAMVQYFLVVGFTFRSIAGMGLCIYGVHVLIKWWQSKEG